MTKPEECVMCSEGCDPAATGILFPRITLTNEYCSWCELGKQKQKEHDLTKLVMPNKPEPTTNKMNHLEYDADTGTIQLTNGSLF